MIKNDYKIRQEGFKAISNCLAFPDGWSGSIKDGYQRGKDQSLFYLINKNNGENHDN